MKSPYIEEIIPFVVTLIAPPLSELVLLMKSPVMRLILLFDPTLIAPPSSPDVLFEKFPVIVVIVPPVLFIAPPDFLE